MNANDIILHCIYKLIISKKKCLSMLKKKMINKKIVKLYMYIVQEGIEEKQGKSSLL